MGKQEATASSINIFCSYVDADEPLHNELKERLSVLQQEGIIASWYDHQIVPGTSWNWAARVDSHLAKASLILLLVSPDFLTSGYMQSTEMQQILERHQTGAAQVVPILLRPVALQDTPLAHFQLLPQEEKPVTTWRHREEAYTRIIDGIRRVTDV